MSSKVRYPDTGTILLQYRYAVLYNITMSVHPKMAYRYETGMVWYVPYRTVWDGIAIHGVINVIVINMKVLISLFLSNRCILVRFPW